LTKFNSSLMIRELKPKQLEKEMKFMQMHLSTTQAFFNFTFFFG